MARIVGIKKRAHGTVTAVSEDGSLFHFRLEYYDAACEAASIESAGGALEALATLPDAGTGPNDSSVVLDDGALAAAIEALAAELRATALLARAEQFRSGLERKLAARGIARQATRLALDRLASAGLLSDERYAASWIRQRCRGHAEGPLSLSAALSARGVDRNAIRDALQATCSGDDRQSILDNAVRLVLRTGADRAQARVRLLAMGWRHAEIDDALDDAIPSRG